MSQSPPPPDTPATPEPGDSQEFSGNSGKKLLDCRILALAIPSLGSLVAEPLFVLIDSAVVGRLGTNQLAGLSVASTVLTTIVGLCVFLAYATTASVSRKLGAGHTKEALRSGIDGIWLAIGLGIILALGLLFSAPYLLAALGAKDAVLTNAVAYLRWSAPGLPGMLLVLAATGVLRGFQDTKSPLWVASIGAAVNALLSVALVYGAGMGTAGSGLGTAITQLAMGAVLATLVARGAKREGISLRPATHGILSNVRTGTPLLIRTLSLRVAIILTVFTATGLGATVLAGHQVVNSVWGLAAFALDALAIAAQALIGHSLGSGDRKFTRAAVTRTLQWGVLVGAVLGVIIAVGGWWFAPLFTHDPLVREAVMYGCIVAGVFMPIMGWVCVLDGVLIGAGDGVYLAKVGVLNLVVYAPFVWAVHLWAPTGAMGLMWLWLSFAGVYIGIRAVTTGVRASGTAWMKIG